MYLCFCRVLEVCLKILNALIDSSVLETASSVLGSNLQVGWSEDTALRAVNLLLHLWIGY